MTSVPALYALLVRPTGEVELTDWTADTTAAALLAADCTEPFEVARQLTAWVDDHAVPLHLPANHPASALVRMYLHIPAPYFGPVLFTGRLSDDPLSGGAHGLTEDQALILLDRVLNAISRVGVSGGVCQWLGSWSWVFVAGQRVVAG
ncbi:hypothetical protein, partial [Streptomyces sp. NPDC089799]|uniref:hypothetical protein n=1 Tax=Streptomyces sp. NPDC089799 TaxID=3155066 RepID=UPI00341591E7